MDMDMDMNMGTGYIHMYMHMYMCMCMYMYMSRSRSEGSSADATHGTSQAPVLSATFVHQYEDAYASQCSCRMVGVASMPWTLASVPRGKSRQPPSSRPLP